MDNYQQYLGEVGGDENLRARLCAEVAPHHALLNGETTGVPDNTHGMQEHEDCG